MLALEAGKATAKAAALKSAALRSGGLMLEARG
jgi:hypothetical protein